MDSPWFAEVDALYERAFPLHEQRETPAKKSALSNDNYALLAWFDGEQFIGLTGSWRFPHYCYIEHLAVNDQLRSQGYGKRMLNQLLHMHPLTILEIDPLTTDIAHKRLRFLPGPWLPSECVPTRPPELSSGNGRSSTDCVELPSAHQPAAVPLLQ
jgi:Acetyltransferase (GNAT) family.